MATKITLLQAADHLDNLCEQFTQHGFAVCYLPLKCPGYAPKKDHFFMSHVIPWPSHFNYFIPNFPCNDVDVVQFWWDLDWPCTQEPNRHKWMGGKLIYLITDINFSAILIPPWLELSIDTKIVH